MREIIVSVVMSTYLYVFNDVKKERTEEYVPSAGFSSYVRPASGITPMRIRRAIIRMQTF